MFSFSSFIANFFIIKTERSIKRITCTQVLTRKLLILTDYSFLLTENKAFSRIARLLHVPILRSDRTPISIDRNICPVHLRFLILKAASLKEYAVCRYRSSLLKRNLRIVHIGVYGDVQRVKILYNKKDSALIQMAEPHQALLGEWTFFWACNPDSKSCGLVINPINYNYIIINNLLNLSQKNYFYKRNLSNM